jgi:hypothetical protein
MVRRTHEAIALGPTGNLQGSVKFYCINMGRVLKQRSFTPMPMPDLVIQRVNRIGEQEKQGWTFWFLNRRGEPYEWTDKVPEDYPGFQGLLDENGDTAVYPDVSAELPGVELESEEQDFQTVTDEPKPDFHDLAGAALHNAGIKANEMNRNAQGKHAQAPGPALINADKDKIVYELMFDLLDAGLNGTDAENMSDMGNSRQDDTSAVVMGADDKATSQRYPTQTCRSAVGNQPYDTYVLLPKLT